jgi:uncharacterized membrane protein YciS (DUF1049 family)
MNTMLSEILVDASYTFIIIGTFIALIFGLGLIFAPVITLKFNEKINTRFSMRKATKKIETAIKSEPFFYKHSKVSGAILITGSLFVLYTLTTFNAYTLLPHLPKSISPTAWEWIIESIQIFFYITCSFIFVFGLIVFTRPSLVKNFELAANHWISTRKGFSKMTMDINITNKLVNTYPRLFGSFITILSLIVLFLLLPEL